jgi:transcription elongation factor
MGWTAPRTWVAAETVTAALFNAHLRDNLKAIADPWVSYTPAWTSSGTAPALGNGTIVGASRTLGPKTVHFYILLTMGSTTTYGTGTYRLSLPTAAASRGTSAGMVIAGHLWDNGVALWGVQSCRFVTTSTIELLAPTATADARLAVVAQTVPFTFGNTDVITISGTYEAA